MDDHDGEGRVVSGAIAVVTGALTMALVLALGLAARPRTPRRRTDALTKLRNRRQTFDDYLL